MKNTPSPVVCPAKWIITLIERTRCVVVAAALSVTVSAAPADVVIEWNKIALDTTESVSDPARILRTMTILQIAVFEAVNSITGDYETYLKRIDAPAGASAEAAAIAAAHRALVTLHFETAPTLDPLRASSLATIPDGPGKAHGISVGVAAADAIVALRHDDGFDKIVPYTPGNSPGDWRPTPPDLTPAFRPGLGDVAPFALKSGRQFRADPPPDLRSGKYARDFNEVKNVGAVGSKDRSVDRTNVAHLYAAAGPERIYFPVAQQVSAAQGKSLSENARTFALVAIAIWDAAVACFDTKYHCNFWRPVTAIRGAEADGNHRTDADPNWAPLVFTPPFPGYASGHAIFGGATRVVLDHVFGPGSHAITLTHPAVPGIVLRYRTFKQITDDIDDARVYGGVHFRFDQEAGARQGRLVGDYILRHKLRPVRGPDWEKR